MLDFFIRHLEIPIVKMSSSIRRLATTDKSFYSSHTDERYQEQLLKSCFDLLGALFASLSCIYQSGVFQHTVWDEVSTIFHLSKMSKHWDSILYLPLWPGSWPNARSLKKNLRIWRRSEKGGFFIFRSVDLIIDQKNWFISSRPLME